MGFPSDRLATIWPDMSGSGTLDESDILVRLNYLDKTFAAYQRVEAGASRLLRLQAVLSVLVIALATGLVSADEDLEIAGIEFKLPLWFLLGGGGIAAASAAIMTVIQDWHAEHLYKRLYTAYEDLGFGTPREQKEGGAGLAGTLPEIATHMWQASGGFMPTVYVLVSFAVLVVLPLAAQVSALLKLGVDFDWSWHVWLPLGASLIVSAAAFTSWFSSDMSR